MLIHKSDGDKYVLQEYAHLATNYDRRWSFYIQTTIRETLKRLNLKPTENLLDIGCGTGALLDKVCSTSLEIRATGIDPSPEMLNIARGKLPDKVEIKEGLAEELPLNDKTFDIVVSCNSFHFWRKPDKALSEIKRVLKPGGRLVITDWCDDYLTCRIFDFYLRLFNRAYFKAYGIKECEALLETKRFSEISIERYKINWFWGMMTAKANRSVI